MEQRKRRSGLVVAAAALGALGGWAWTFGPAWMFVDHFVLGSTFASSTTYWAILLLAAVAVGYGSRSGHALGIALGALLVGLVALWPSNLAIVLPPVGAILAAWAAIVWTRGGRRAVHPAGPTDRSMS